MPGDAPRLTLVSGGQTGVDRAALDVALELGLECGGWCPAGRWAEDGRIPERYPLRPTPTPHPAERTEWNVRDSDGTLLLTTGAPSPGTDLTVEVAMRLRRPLYRWHPGAPPDREAFLRWIQIYRITRLNVAGPRESDAPGIYAAARDYLRAVLDPEHG